MTACITTFDLRKITLFSLLAVTASSDAQSLQLADQKFFGGSGNEAGTGVAVVANGGGFSIYASGSSAALGGEGLVVKYTIPSASLVSSQSWSIGFPTVAGADQFNGIVATPTNVYAAGYSFSHTTDTVGSKEQKGIVVNFTEAAGSVVWERQTPAAPGAYPYGGAEGLNGIAAAVQGGQQAFFAVGAGQSGFSNGGRLYISKLDAAGNVLWTRTNDNGGAAPSSSGNAVAANATHAVLAGATSDPGVQTSLLRSYDASGGLAWSQTSTAGRFDGVTLDTPGNSLFAVGRTNGVLSDFLIEKRGLDGSLAWSRTFDRSGAEDFLSGVTMLDGRLFAVGSTRGGTAGGSDGVVLEFNPLNGDLLATTLWGGVFDDSFSSVGAGLNALHLVGTTRSFGAGGSDMAFVTFFTGVPEPTQFAMVGAGCLALFFTRRRRADGLSS
jgi:hypothetical protein